MEVEFFALRLLVAFELLEAFEAFEAFCDLLLVDLLLVDLLLQLVALLEVRF